MDIKKDKLIYFNLISNIFILLVLFFGSLSYADSNGIWTLTKDIRGGTFGSDEAGLNSNYTFANPVYFTSNIIATGVSTFNDLRSTLFNTNSANVNGNLNVTTDINLLNTLNCNTNQKLSTDVRGKIVCGTDDDIPESGDFGAAIDLDSSGAVSVNSVALGTDTTGDYAGSTSEAGAATDLSCTNCIGATEIGDGLGVAEINEAVIQQRVSGTCPAGSSIRVISQGGGVTCEPDNVGITSETDPQVASTTSGKWCTGTGSQVTCTSNPPTFSEVDTLQSVTNRGASTNKGISINDNSIYSSSALSLISNYGNGIFSVSYTSARSAVFGYATGLNSYGIQGYVSAGTSWAGYFSGGKGVYVSSCSGCSVLAEMIEVNETPNNGEILCTNPNNGDVEACLGDKSSRVKGIAQVNAEMVLRRGCSKTLEENGTNGMSLGGISPENILKTPECKGWYPVALSGLSEKTFVVCSSPNGKNLAYGDILVTSNVSGHLRPLDDGEDALSYQVVGRADSICGFGKKTDKINVWIN